MATSSIQNIPTLAAANDAAAKAKLGQRSLGQDDFLRLMTAQLQYQDPFNPTDNGQMVAQMAQMSSLTGITEMSSTLKTLADRMGSGTSDAVSWIGKAVLTESATATADTKGNVTGAVELDAEAAQVNVEIRDASGNVARAVSLGAQGAGLVDYQWDGRTDDGSAAGAGPYTISVAAADRNGQVVKARNLAWTGVASVMPNGGKPMLTLSSGEQVLADSVRKIA
ncbi:flagellar hook assembly protein FlgD [Sphingomonas hankookensis]|uniref:Basal-body rod modification protein FlgD n=1 Tax=Sphingomonas hengshuiensis TaxID=1609977 RepID=A0A2W4ZFM5_9SPHN|nr:MAG: flagellar hook capping protein [Sphingomonas hengshuiensis]